jgi:integrase
MGGAKAWKYGQIKAVISFGLKAGLDRIQIRAALDRAKILWTSDKLPAPKPCPINREDFHKLMTAATPANNRRAWLLVGLNLCLHLGEVITLKWDSLDLGAGTHAQLREKTNTGLLQRKIWAMGNQPLPQNCLLVRTADQIKPSGRQR